MGCKQIHKKTGREGQGVVEGPKPAVRPLGQTDHDCGAESGGKDEARLKSVDSVNWHQWREMAGRATGPGVFLRVQYQPRKKGHDNRICRARGNVSGYNELRNVNSSCFSASVSSRKCRVTCSASSLCRSMAFSSVKDRRSCM